MIPQKLGGGYLWEWYTIYDGIRLGREIKETICFEARPHCKKALYARL